MVALEIRTIAWSVVALEIRALGARIIVWIFWSVLLSYDVVFSASYILTG